MTRVDFCVPIRYEGTKTCMQQVCEGIEDYFYLRGKVAYVIPGTEKASKGIQEVQIRNQNRIKVGQVILGAIKVLSYILSAGFIPLAMLCAKAIFRAKHKFHEAAPKQNDKAQNDKIQNNEAVKQIQNKKPNQIQNVNTVAGLMDRFTKAWNVEKKDFDFPEDFDLIHFAQMLENHAKEFKIDDLDFEKHFGYIEKVDLDPAQNPKIYKHADFHGDLKSLLENLRTLQAEGLMDQNYKCKPGFHLEFLGDYCDRGKYGTQILEMLMLLREENPGQVHIIRGNHEEVNINADFGGNDERLMKIVHGKAVLGHNRAKEALQSFYETMPLSTYYSVLGEGREYVQDVHGAFEPTMDPDPLLRSPETQGYILVPIERKLSERVRKIAEGNSPLAEAAKRMEKLAHGILDKDITAYNWGDLTEEESRGGYLGNRQVKFNAKDIRAYLDLSCSEHRVAMLFRGHEHKFQHLMDGDQVIATTLPVGMDCPAYGWFGQPDRAYIIEPKPKVADWTKRAILRETGHDRTDEVTQAYPLTSAAI